MIILTKMQFESKFLHDVPAFKYKFEHSFLASEASQKKIFDFDVSNMSISEFWVRLLETFFHSAIEQDYFFQPKSEQGITFWKNSKPLPPEYQMDRALWQSWWFQFAYNKLSVPK